MVRINPKQKHGSLAVDNLLTLTGTRRRGRESLESKHSRIRKEMSDFLGGLKWFTKNTNLK